jgi:hypothetical protein
MVTDPSELSMKVAGPRAWHIIEHAYQQADKIAQEAVRDLPCRSCSGEEGLELVRFVHDVKNIELGKPVYDKAAFQSAHKRVDDAAAKAGIGRNTLNTGAVKGAPEPKMRDYKTTGIIYAGAATEKLIDIGVKSIGGAPLVPGVRNSTLYNAIALVIGVVPTLLDKGTETIREFGDAFSAGALNNLLEDAAIALGVPQTGAVRVTVPFQPAGPIISPSQAAAQSGAPALF